MVLDAELGEFPEDDKVAGGKAAPGKAAPTATVTALGLVMSRITPERRKRFKLGKKVKGVVVTDVKGGSSAAEKRVRPGDIVRKIGPDHDAVKNPAQVKSKIETARKNNMKTILFLFERDGNPRFVAFKLELARRKVGDPEAIKR